MKCGRNKKVSEMNETNRYMDQILEVRHQSPEEERDLCLKLLEADETEYARAFAHTYLADAYHSMGLLTRAMEQYHTAMELIEKNNFEKLSLTLYNLAGVIYIGLDDEQGALDCFFKEVEIAEQMEDYMMCSAALANIAYVYRGAGAFRKAERTLKRAHEMALSAEENDTNIEFTEDFYNMLRAGLALEEGKPEKALKCLGNVGEQRQQSLDMTLMYASCYAKTGKKQAALKGIDSSLDAVEDIRNRFERLSHYFDILDVLLELEEYEKAEKFVRKAEGLLSEMENTGKWSRLMDYEIRIYTALGDARKLDRAYQLFFEYNMKFKEASKKAVVKRLRKRIELQEEANKRVDMEAWQNVLYKRSEYDELTGVLNRRGIRKYMTQAFSDAKKTGSKFAVLIVDVDFFKEFNDTYGHVAGDECLKQIANVLKKAVPGSGLAGRYGGDEFLLTIGGSQTMSVMEVAMEIKASLEELGIVNKNSTVSKYVTVTIGGINVIPAQDHDFSRYVEEADKVLYGLKKNSKNGFVIVESLQGDENGQAN